VGPHPQDGGELSREDRRASLVRHDVDDGHELAPHGVSGQLIGKVVQSDPQASATAREDPRGVDLAIDSVGGQLFDTILANLGVGGRLVVVGYASDMGADHPEPVYRPRVYADLYWKAASVRGFQNAFSPQTTGRRSIGCYGCIQRDNCGSRSTQPTSAASSPFWTPWITSSAAGASGRSLWMSDPTTSERSGMPDRQWYDIVVVGAGTAGIPCALAAVEAGARVLLLEKDDRVGGTLHTTGGHLSAAGTRRQAAMSIEDDPEQHLADVRRISRGSARDDLVQRAVALAPAAVDWLDHLGFDFAPETPRLVFGHEPYSVPRTYYGRDAGLSILKVLEPLLRDAIEHGAIDLRIATPVTALRCDGSGRVVGVTVWGQDSDQHIDAGAVVLATGGFAADADVFAEIEGVRLVSAAHPTSTGDGLLLARSVGAAVAGHGTYLPTFGGLPHPTSPNRAQWSDRPLLVAAERPPWEIYVDRLGRRFVAEDEPSIDQKERALAAVADMTFWTVFDDRARRESVPIVVGWSPEDLAANAGRRAGVHRSDDVQSLARLAGIDATGLLSTIESYNADLGAGRPDSLGRRHRPAPIVEPPFFALENHGITLISFAGVDVDADLAVRRPDGSVVPELFAVGEVIGAYATCGNSFCGGMMVTPAISLARWLGARLGARRPA
jgi:succinate dehydrogenase/fumarate reductase flavoprotein subunit